MSGDRFTPGPWELIGAQGTAVWAGDKIIASMSEARSNHKQARRDARLIAAAPELLAALRLFAAYDSLDPATATFAEMTCDYHDAIEAARQALARATGDGGKGVG